MLLSILLIIQQKHQILPGKDMPVKVFMVLEPEQRTTRKNLADLSILSQYLILQLKSITTYNFAWQKRHDSIIDLSYF